MILDKKRKIYIVIAVIYCLIMAYLLFARNIQKEPSYNMVPFKTIALFVDIIKKNYKNLSLFAYANLLGNVIMFIPLGYLPPAIFPKLRNSFAAAFLYVDIIAIIEILQFVTARGIADIDDLILNFFGAIIGYNLYKIINKNGSSKT